MKRITLGFILTILLAAVNSGVAACDDRCGDPDAPKPKGHVPPGHNIKVLSRPAPSYPAEAKAAKIAGKVLVGVIFDEEGRVIWARSEGGHPLLQRAAVEAACKMRAKPKTTGKVRVKFYGISTYNFVLD